MLKTILVQECSIGKEPFYIYLLGCWSISSIYIFLAAQSSSRSLVVGVSVCLSVCRLVCWERFVKKLPLEYHMVTKTYLPTYLCDNSDNSHCSDSSDSSDSIDSSDCRDSRDSSDSTDQKNLFHNQNFFNNQNWITIFFN